MKTGKCENGDKCRFAHGEAELRKPKKNKKKKAKTENIPPTFVYNPPVFNE